MDLSTRFSSTRDSAGLDSPPHAISTSDGAVAALACSCAPAPGVALEGDQLTPFGRSLFIGAAGGEHGVLLGDYFLGPSLDALVQQLAENDAARHGTPPAKKEAVEAMPGLPGGLRARRARPRDALQAQVPRQLHRAVARDAQLLPCLPVPAAGHRRQPLRAMPS
jgi:hypothetical protein